MNTVIVRKSNRSIKGHPFASPPNGSLGRIVKYNFKTSGEPGIIVMYHQFGCGDHTFKAWFTLEGLNWYKPETIDVELLYPGEEVIITINN